MNKVTVIGYGLAAVLFVGAAASGVGWLAIIGTAVGCTVCSWHRGLWEASLTLFVTVSILRNGMLAGPLLPSMVWYGLQFAGLAGIGILTIVGKGPGWTIPRAKLRVVIAAGIFVLACALSTLLSPNPLVSAKVLAPLVAMMALLLVCYAWRWRDVDIVRNDLLLVVVLIGALTAVGLIGFLARAAWSSSGWNRFSGLTGNANYAGQLAALSLAVLAGYARPKASTALRWGQIALAAVLFFAVFASGSRGAVIAAFAGVTLALWWRPEPSTTRWRLVTQGIVLLLPILAMLPGISAMLLPPFPPTVVTPDGTVTTAPVGSVAEPGGGFDRPSLESDITSGRGEIYREMLHRFTQHPLVGSGFGTQPLYTAHGMQGHNLYLQILAETGAIGFASLAVALLLLLRAGGFPKAQPLGGAVFAVLVFELTETSVFGWMSPSGLLSWLILLGFGAATLQRAEDVSVPAAVT